MKRIDHIKRNISIVFRALLVIALFWSAISADYMNVLISVVTLILTFLPSLLEHRFKVDYPSEFEITILIFIFLSLFLGEIGSFYEHFWWWDLFLHTISAVLIGDFAFSLVYILNREKAISLSPVFTSLFAFSFAVMIGALWEIFEFLMDVTLGLNMQKSGLIDTMTDLMVDAIGGGAVAVIGFLILTGKVHMFDNYLENFIKRNRQWFKEGIPQ
jgi:hypothetical protein